VETSGLFLQQCGGNRKFPDRKTSRNIRNLSESICNFQAEVFAAPRQPHLSTGTVEALDAGVDPASAALSPKSVIRSIASGLVYASVVLFQTLYHLEPAYRRLCMHFTFAF